MAARLGLYGSKASCILPLLQTFQLISTAVEMSQPALRHCDNIAGNNNGINHVIIKLKYLKKNEALNV